ncbi:putative RNA-directed DNA polymerase from transposon BS [Colletotrichum tanaceti]|uniref:Putative RNA-directed DNA polymerase from transposon BS n=1 Tax=Colletotrichum tanaceti TaxID=1306861 RepID=A0A4U6XUS9_9PEZI|nr:putative RNA-directed DNA polymerase from transposon BS [Colletotrichum tanaceti]TKW59704.1 putative RNA-directed DNA polymerase from transposon BS [Colletotrichum tanaceti]
MADIIGIQDPPPEFAWWQSRGYKAELCAVRPLKEDDGPFAIACAESEKKRRKKLKRSKSAEEPQPPKELVSLYRIGFYVHDSIPLADWDVFSHDNGNKSMVATLKLSTRSGSIAIHNVYNHTLKLDMAELLATCTTSPSDLLLGDFNLHHPLWGGPNVKPNSPQAEQLYHGTQIAGMRCLTKPTVTYSRGTQNDGSFCSTIDLAFAGCSIADQIQDHGPLTVRGFESDHRVIQTILSLEPGRVRSTRHVWSQVNRSEFRRDVAAQLEDARLLGRLVCSKTGVDHYFFDLLQILRDAIAHYVPLADPRSVHRRPKPVDEIVKLNLALERQALSNLTRGLGSEADFYHYRRRVNYLLKTREARHFRQAAAGNTREPQSLYRLARWGVQSCAPRGLSHMPPLLDSDGGTCVTGEEKARCIRNSFWPDTSTGPTAPALPLPHPNPDSDPDPERQQLYSPDRLESGEIESLLDQLPTGKSPGPDGIPAEALKMLHRVRAADGTELAPSIIAPYLERGINAAFRLSHHPSIFKLAKTVVLPKVEKEAYNVAKSYRPLALLSFIGKLVEKAIANRLKFLAMAHQLIPGAQFALPGKSTTHALESLVNHVYQAWCVKAPADLKATLMTIDQTGAFDHVGRQNLLEVLIQLGIPTWLVLYVRSFLSDRSTFLVLPCHTSERFWVNIGIPQGSPLSPILYLYFSRQILGRLKASCPWADAVLATSYMDDTCILVTSPSYTLNCAALEFLFGFLIAWASPNGIHFGAGKTKIMHFHRPWSRCLESTEMPKIEGLPGPEDCLQTKLRLLGVILDNRLSWVDHVDFIIAKVQRKMMYLRRISGSTWGPSLLEMRQLYITCIRPVFAYACAVWFVYSAHQTFSWRLRDDIVRRLNDQQSACLRQIAGAFKTTSSEILHKELHIDKLSLYLERTAMAYRVQNLDSEDAKKLETTWNTLFRDKEPIPRLDHHPYRLLYLDACRACHEPRRQLEKKVLARYPRSSHEKWRPSADDYWAEPVIRKTIMRDALRRHTERESALQWETYRTLYSSRHSPAIRNPPALQEGWGRQSLGYYKGLTRAQSTMLLQCRTGVIGLKSYLYSLNTAKTTVADTFMCQCGTAAETAKHLFVDCPDLRVERAFLRREVAILDFHRLVTTDAKIATAWAIRFFGLTQFRWIAQNMSPPLSA